MKQAARRTSTAVRISVRFAALAVVMVPVLVSIGMTVASATPDTTSPVMFDEQFSPSTIDTVGDTTVVVTVHAGDDVSGVDDVEACFQSPSHAQSQCGAVAEPVSGSPTDGVFEVSVAFPAGRQVGAWALTHLMLRDAAGNLRFVYAAELSASQLPTTLTVVDDPSVPDQPTGVTASPGNAQASVTWTAPDFDGGAPITGYTVTPYVGGAPLPQQTFSGSSTTQTLTGLSNGTGYAFGVAAINVKGTGTASDLSAAVTPATVPDPPTMGAATRGNSEAVLWWTAPASDGGSPITGYRVTPYIGLTPQTARSFSTPATTQTITGLTNGTTYSFRVAAVNNRGTSGDSEPSNLVTPANRPPVAVAGPDQTVKSSADFTLTGTASSDPDGDVLRFAWSRISGPQVTMRNGSTAIATVTGVRGPTTLVFRLTVTDPDGHVSTDDVTITVTASPK